jgi:hypothetical protein
MVHMTATVTIQPPARKMPELPWLVMLGWYLAILAAEEAGAVAATTAATT